MNKIKNKKKKIIILGLIIISIISFFTYKQISKSKTQVPTYTLGSVENGNIVLSLSTTGQVNTLDQIDVKSKISGDVLLINVKEGQSVKKGDVIAKIDTIEIQKSLRGAEISYLSAKNNLEEVNKAATELQLLQAEQSLNNAKSNLDKLKKSQETEYKNTEKSIKTNQEALENAYSNIINTVASSFTTFASTINDFRTYLYQSNLIPDQNITGTDLDKNLIDLNNIWNVEIPKYWEDISNSTIFDNSEDKDYLIELAKKATAEYRNARTMYDSNVSESRSLNTSSDKVEIENFLNKTINIAEQYYNSSRALANLYDYYITYNNDRRRTLYYNVNTYYTSIKSYVTSTNNSITSLQNLKTGTNGIETVKENLETSKNNLENLIENQPQELAQSEMNLKIQEASYNELKAGPDELMIKKAQLSVQEALDNLNNLKNQLSYSTIQAEYDGVISSVNVKKGDNIANNTIIATLISKNYIVETSFSEVDIAKLKVGQKAILNFDAIENLELIGEISSIDAVGTSSQGVISYGIKIGLESNDDRIKSGMTSTIKIILDTKQNVLTVANSAVKKSGITRYIEIFKDLSDQEKNNTQIKTNKKPERQIVEIGISNDSYTEITSGLNEGDLIIIKTSIPSSTSSQTSSPQGSLFQSTGGTRMNFGGGANIITIPKQ